MWRDPVPCVGVGPCKVGVAPGGGGGGGTPCKLESVTEAGSLYSDVLNPLYETIGFER